MTVTYETGSGLYVNVTNRCTNRCAFCVRTKPEGERVVGENLCGDLWLDREPTVEEIYESIVSRDLSKYTELVFCGFGEPTERLDDILEVVRRFKAEYDLPVRLNTNGHASLIAGEDVTPRFADSFDTVSVSLNAATAADYVELCSPDFGEAAFNGLLTFARDVKEYVPTVLLSIVRGSIPDGDIEKCQKLADSCGVKLRIREML